LMVRRFIPAAVLVFALAVSGVPWGCGRPSRSARVGGWQQVAAPPAGSAPSPGSVSAPGAEPPGFSGHAPTLPAVTPTVVFHGPRDARQIALTFDACETEKPAGYDADIVRVLKATRTPATLFLGGKWMESHPEVTRALAQDPLFELGNHSYIHPHLTKVSAERVRDEIKRTQDVMYALTGRQGRLFRAPFGEYNDAVLRTAGALGLTVIQWDVVSGDPDRNITASRLVSGVLAKAQNGSIVIMHVNGRGWHTAEALPALIAQLRAPGYRLVTVSQLLQGRNG